MVFMSRETNQTSDSPVPSIAVVLPCYKVKAHILDVLATIPSYVEQIYVIDDHCPDESGQHVRNHCNDPRVMVISHSANQGVGGAVITGYKAAIEAEAQIIVKIDGDGQMDPTLIDSFIAPITLGEADYTKGNRFFNLEKIGQMPKARLFGNAALSFLTKLSSGYWNLFDPTNGYTAIHADVARQLPFDKISPRYFFESDMLFRLNTLRAVVVDIPMDAKYGDEVSNLKIKSIVADFLKRHLRNFTKRIFYNYYLRDMSVASIELPIGLVMLLFGTTFGAYSWIKSSALNIPASTGTVMLAALPVILGLQLVLAFLAYDINSVPNRPIHKNRKININKP